MCKGFFSKITSKREQFSFLFSASLILFLPERDMKNPWQKTKSMVWLTRWKCGCGGIGRRARFRLWWSILWVFESLHPHHKQALPATKNVPYLVRDVFLCNVFSLWGCSFLYACFFHAGTICSFLCSCKETNQRNTTLLARLIGAIRNGMRGVVSVCIWWFVRGVSSF